uniref:RdRp n=1 Tax=viral metagenome TaxID=1070528 RepID=A0A2V0RCQ8_9ZZZZ
MTVLRLFESIRLPVKFDSTSITDEYKGLPLDPISNDFELFLNQWFNKFGRTIRNKLTLTKFGSHEPSYRLKRGPMGPSILTSHLDAVVLYANKVYFDIITNFYTLVGSENIISELITAVETCSNVCNSDKLITGRISLVSESAGKTRLFAICNF